MDAVLVDGNTSGTPEWCCACAVPFSDIQEVFSGCYLLP